ncbi:hypothetical protein BGW38_005806 [Lunasporangiospora selenospora]|uniref:F-box domain-containing protein n=1 Tax=Lunasporangiospora selenospora TaxID=979761 RepID=A0A9P6FZF3_9FUNG|nr:hypothetical protein BGW38_005806 [Lunasporangiospora selenospora]
MHITELPAEHFHYILAYLDLPDQHSLLLTCSVLFDKVVPVLYRSPFRALAAFDGWHQALLSPVAIAANQNQSTASVAASHANTTRATASVSWGSSSPGASPGINSSPHSNGRPFRGYGHGHGNHLSSSFSSVNSTSSSSASSNQTSTAATSTVAATSYRGPGAVLVSTSPPSPTSTRRPAPLVSIPSGPSTVSTTAASPTSLTGTHAYFPTTGATLPHQQQPPSAAALQQPRPPNLVFGRQSTQRRLERQRQRAIRRLKLRKIAQLLQLLIACTTIQARLLPALRYPGYGQQWNRAPCRINYLKHFTDHRGAGEIMVRGFHLLFADLVPWVDVADGSCLAEDWEEEEDLEEDEDEDEEDGASLCGECCDCIEYRGIQEDSEMDMVREGLILGSEEYEELNQRTVGSLNGLSSRTSTGSSGNGKAVSIVGRKKSSSTSTPSGSGTPIMLSRRKSDQVINRHSRMLNEPRQRRPSQLLMIRPKPRRPPMTPLPIPGKEAYKVLHQIQREFMTRNATKIKTLSVSVVHTIEHATTLVPQLAKLTRLELTDLEQEFRMDQVLEFIKWHRVMFGPVLKEIILMERGAEVAEMMLNGVGDASHPFAGQGSGNGNSLFASPSINIPPARNSVVATSSTLPNSPGMWSSPIVMAAANTSTPSSTSTMKMMMPTGYTRLLATAAAAIASSTVSSTPLPGLKTLLLSFQMPASEPMDGPMATAATSAAATVTAKRLVQFLDRCRNLEHLQAPIRRADVFSWAATEKRSAMICAPILKNSRSKVLPRMKRLCLEGPTMELIECARDATVAFQDTLEELSLYSRWKVWQPMSLEIESSMRNLRRLTLEGEISLYFSLASLRWCPTLEELNLSSVRSAGQEAGQTGGEYQGMGGKHYYQAEQTFQPPPSPLIPTHYPSTRFGKDFSQRTLSQTPSIRRRHTHHQHHHHHQQQQQQHQSLPNMHQPHCQHRQQQDPGLGLLLYLRSREMDQIAMLPRLERLVLRGHWPVSDTVLRKIAEQCPRLKELSLDQTTGTSIGGLLLAVERMKNLRKLELRLNVVDLRLVRVAVKKLKWVEEVKLTSLGRENTK